MKIVLNEWVFHDLWGQNRERKERETAQFLLSFALSGDSLVVPNQDRQSESPDDVLGCPSQSNQQSVPQPV